jgi:DNA-binding XRE family transcriptional regulator
VKTFEQAVQFHVHECGECGVQFAFTEEFYRRRKEDRKTWYCPNGHPRHFTGPSEESKLRQELERKEQMLSAAQARAATAEQERQQVARAHKKMRERVMNGVCPCCNRTFQNLMQHMRSEHPDFDSIRTMHTLRIAFGMTQADVAREAGVDTAHVSLYERDKPVAGYAKQRLDSWLEMHNAGDVATQQDGGKE